MIALAALGGDLSELSWLELSWPRDPDDLRRCILLLDRCPSAWAGVVVLASLSREWAALRDAWEDLDSLIREEAGGDVSIGRFRAPATHERMKSILDPLRAGRS